LKQLVKALWSLNPDFRAISLMPSALPVKSVMAALMRLAMMYC